MPRRLRGLVAAGPAGGYAQPSSRLPEEASCGWRRSRSARPSRPAWTAGPTKERKRAEANAAEAETATTAWSWPAVAAVAVPALILLVVALA